MKSRHLSFFILVAFTFTSYSQSTIVKGIVKDINSLQPISGANLSTIKANYSTISNDDGAFELALSNAKDTLRIYALGYKEIKMAISDIKETEFYLEPKINDLEEVIVMKGGIQELLERITETSKEKFTAPLLMHSYYREFVKINKRYTKFSDGELSYLLNRKSSKLASILNVKQARAYQIPKTEEDDDADATLDNLNSGFDINGLPAYGDNFKFLEKTLLKDKDFKNYEFILKSKKGSNGDELVTLYFNPVDTVEEYLYKGFIVYNPKTNLIYSISIQKDLSKIQYADEINILLFRFTFLDYNLRVNYKMNNDTYLMSDMSLNMKMNVSNKKKYHHDIEMKSDMVVTNFTKDISSFDSKNLYKKKSLFVYGTKFTTPFWKNNNAILLTDKEQKIIDEIEGK